MCDREIDGRVSAEGRARGRAASMPREELVSTTSLSRQAGVCKLVLSHLFFVCTITVGRRRQGLAKGTAVGRMVIASTALWASV